MSEYTINKFTYGGDTYNLSVDGTVGVVEYDVTTFAEVEQAYEDYDGKLVCMYPYTSSPYDDNTLYWLSARLDDGTDVQYIFTNILGHRSGSFDSVSLDSYGWVHSSGHVLQQTLYGTCNTSASTATKVVTCDGFTDVGAQGVIIGVFFSNGNTAATPTLNVNSTGSTSIYVGNSAPNGTTNVLKWSARTMVYFMYDATAFRYICSVSAGDVTPSRGANTWYGTSSTGGNYPDKEATIDNYVLTKGSLVSITFQWNDFASDKITLNINSTGAKDVYFKGAVTSSTNQLHWAANDTLTFMYDGTNYHFISRANNKEGTVKWVGISNATDGGLTISNSPITDSGSITVGHSNVLSNSQTTSGIYPIKIDINGHISEYGNSVTIPTKVSDLTNDSGFVTTDRKLLTTAVQSGQLYYPVLGPDNTIAESKYYDSKGLSYVSTQGTAQVPGTAVLTVGGILGSDTADKRIGELKLYSETSGSVTLKLAAGNSTDYTATFQKKTGTIALTSDIPDVSGKIDTAGTGLSKSGTTLNHSNSVTAQTTSAVYPIKIDAQGHISEYGSAVTITDTKVTQTVDTSTNSAFSLLFENSSNSGTVTDGSKKSTGLTYNPYGETLQVRNATIDYNLNAPYIYGSAVQVDGISTSSLMLVAEDAEENIYTVDFDLSDISSDVSLTVPSSSGTLALTSDIPTVPTKTSDLTNDSGFVTTDEKVKTENYNTADSTGHPIVFNKNSTVATTESKYATSDLTFSKNDSNYATLAIGNNASMKGRLRINTGNGNSGDYTYLISSATATSKTITLPDATGTVALTSDIPTVTDEKVSTAAVTSGTTYYPTVGTNTTNAETKYFDATGLKYTATTGTSSSIGYSVLTLGNNTASGTAGNKIGEIDIYSSSTHCASLIAAPSLASDREIVLPDKSGTVALTSDIPTVTDEKLKTGSITSGTTYFPVVGSSSISAETKKVDLTGLAYVGTSGTSSADGSSILILGNATASGTSGNKEGRIRLWGTGDDSAVIAAGALTDTRTITLPDASGTVALTSDTTKVQIVRW